MSGALQALLASSVPVGATIGGGVLAALHPFGPRLRASVQHFAAGVVFAAVAGELLPKLQGGAAWVVAIGFVSGTVLVLAVTRLSERAGAVGEGKAESPTGLIVAVGVDIFLDGVLVGVGFAAGSRQGVLLTLALTLEVLFVGVSVATALQEVRASRARILVTVAALALLLAVGAALGGAVVGQLSGAVLVGVFALGSAALLNLVTEELLVEAHEVPDTQVATAMFFVGFLVLLLLDAAT